MDKPKKAKKKPSRKVIDYFSSRETTPDPFSDDGEYGSDVDYDPNAEKSEGDSSSNVSDTHSESSNSRDDSDDSELSSSESIFDTRKRKLSTNKESKRKKCKLQTKNKLCTGKASETKKSKPENDKDSDINSVVSLSINSDVLRRNIDALNLQESLLLNNLTDIEVQSQLLSDNHTIEDQASGAQSSLAIPESTVENSMTSVIQSFSSSSKHTNVEGNLTLYVQPQSSLSGPQSRAQLRLPPLDSENTEGDLTFNAQQNRALPDSTPCPSLDPANKEGYQTPSVQQHTSSPNPIVDSSLDSADTDRNLPSSAQHHMPSATYAQSTLPLSEPTSRAHSPRDRTLSTSDNEENPENENDTAERRQRSFTPTSTHDWENTTANIPVFEFDESSAGVQFEITPDMSPIDVFNKLYPEQIIEYIVAKTNEYGRALFGTNRPGTRNTPTRKPKYKNLVSEEMKKFLGLCLLMGQVKIPQRRKLFTYSDPLYYHPVFQFVMSARRFEQILRCLCVSELNSKGKEKILKFIDLITRTFRECFKPSKELSLDESLLLFSLACVSDNTLRVRKLNMVLNFMS